MERTGLSASSGGRRAAQYSLRRDKYYGAAVCITDGPVSYTHLDVYKRQPHDTVNQDSLYPFPNQITNHVGTPPFPLPPGKGEGAEAILRLAVGIGPVIPAARRAAEQEMCIRDRFMYAPRKNAEIAERQGYI